MIFLKKLLPVLIVLLFSLFTILPLFHAGLFPMHDDTQVQRVFEMAQSLQDGMFPVRWVNDLGYGYGYPIFNYYAPLAYYVGGVFVLLGFSSLIATKIMMGIGMVLAGLGMYYLGKFFWGTYGGIIAGVFYTFATYHAVELFVRGDVGELWAYGLLPFAFFAFLKSAKEKKWQYFLLGALFFTSIILSHNLTAMMVTPILFIAVIYASFHYKNWLAMYAFGVGLLLAGFYWLPAVTETSYTNVLAQIGGAADFHQHFVCPIQFWYSPWGYGGSTSGCSDGLSFMVGKLHMIFALFACIFSFFFLKKKRQYVILTSILFLGFLFSLFIQTNYAVAFWNMLKPMALFQYPWRFLILTSFFASLLAGSIFFFLQQITFPKKTHIGILFFTTAVLLITLWLQVKFFVPLRLDNYPSSFYINKTMLTFTTSKISDEYMPKGFHTPQTAQQVTHSLLNEHIAVVTLNKTQEKILQVHLTKQSVVHFNLAYFPAWKLFVQNHSVPLQRVSTGMQALLPSGNYQMRLVYQQTAFELIGNGISLAGILFLLLAIIRMRKKII